MEPQGALPHSQVPATFPYPEPGRSSLNNNNNNNETKLKIITLTYGKEVILLSSLEYKNFQISRPMYQFTPRGINWYMYQTVWCRITVDHHIRLDSSTRLWTTNIYIYIYI